MGVNNGKSFGFLLFVGGGWFGWFICLLGFSLWVLVIFLIALLVLASGFMGFWFV